MLIKVAAEPLLWHGLLSLFLAQKQNIRGEELMNIRLAWASAIGVLALAAPAVAHTVDCTVDSDRLQEALSRLERGSTLTIKGKCVGNVTVATDGASLVAHPSGRPIPGQREALPRRAR